MPEEGDVTIYRVWRVDLGETEADAVEVRAGYMRGAAIAYAERQDKGHPSIALGEIDVVVAVRRGADEAQYLVDGEMIPLYRVRSRAAVVCTCGHDESAHVRTGHDDGPWRCIAPRCACQRFKVKS